MIRALTYNVSWATQSNKVAGSEKDFVQACQTKYSRGGNKCNGDAIRKLKTVGRIDVLGLQEVNSNIVQKIQKIVPNLTHYIPHDFLYDRTGNIIGVSPENSVQIMWDPFRLGSLQYHTTFNIVDSGKDIRMCMILHLKKDNDNFIIINLHAPWASNFVYDKDGKKIGETIQGNKLVIGTAIHKELQKHPHLEQIITTDPHIKIICMGDFNDPQTRISSGSPLILKIRIPDSITPKDIIIPLSQHLTRKNIRDKLKTCCWHEVGFEGEFEGFKYGHFTDTGDYVLTNAPNCTIHTLVIPESYNLVKRDDILLSDHKPVLAMINY